MMNTGHSVRFIFLGAFFCTICLCSCAKTDVVKSVDEVDLFSLSYGMFDDQLNLFDLSNVGTINTTMTMRDGFFYIANGESKKIMELNSYGDLLTLYYSEEGDRKGMLPSEKPSNIRKPITFPIDFSGAIAVDSKKNIYIVGTLPKERQERDEDDNLLNSQIVLRFTDNGNSIDYLGQQGVGGTPFPLVRNVYTTADDEIVVVCTTNTGSLAYWFSSAGALMYKVPIDTKTVPSLPDASSFQSLYPSIENVIPDYTERKLFVKVDYYASSVDKESKVQSGIDYVRTLLYPLDIEKGTYERSIFVPPYEESLTADYSKIVYKLPYDYLGTTRSGWQFFIVSTTTGFNIQMIQPVTQKIIKRHFDVSHKDVLYYTFSLSDTGIISALFSEKDKSKVIWWRTDSLAASLVKS